MKASKVDLSAYSREELETLYLELRAFLPNPTLSLLVDVRNISRALMKISRMLEDYIYEDEEEKEEN